MRKSIFSRIFLTYAILLILSMLSMELYITSAVRENHLDSLRRDLSIQADLAAKSLFFEQSNLDEMCVRLKEIAGARITVIASDGKVIGDSDHDSSLMDNHAGRTEIGQAALYGKGTTIRYSETMEYDFLYVARKVMIKSTEEGFVRLAVPLRDIDEAVNLLRIKITLIVGLILLLTGAFAIWQTDHLRRLLKQVMDFSRSLAQGKIDGRLFLKEAAEFDDIAGNLNAMSVTLQGMMSQIEEERNQLNVILKSIPDALLIIDSRGSIIISSSSSGEFFGDLPLQGRQFIEVVRSHEFAAVMEEVRKTLLPGMTEFSLDCPDERYIAVRVSPLFYKAQEFSGFVAIFHDITMLKRLEHVRKDFVANVSHEIKTPVTAIKGFADTLLEGALDDRENAIKFLQTIKSNSERINSLVDDLMTISKIELGVIRVDKALIKIDDVIENVSELLGSKAAGKNLYLRPSVKSGLKEITADKNRLVQIFINLVDNAIKFTDTGGVTFGMEEEDSRSFLFVEDTGIGIPEKHLPRLGERFYRVDPARSRKMGGTGLGLAIVKHLVKAHGWDMHIESVPGKGTKIRIMPQSKRNVHL